MLKRDDELRLSDATQRAYAKYSGDVGGDKIRITEAVQRRVCREFGFADNIAEGLEVMRCASAMFPGDAGVRDACHYLRYNIHVPCPLSVGQTIPNIALYCCSSEKEGLHSLCSAFEGPTLLLAGSTT